MSAWALTACERGTEMSACEQCGRLTKLLEAERKAHYFTQEKVKGLRSALANSRAQTKRCEEMVGRIDPSGARRAKIMELEDKILIGKRLRKADQRRKDNG